VPAYRVRQTLYTPESFVVLRDKVSAFFSLHGWCTGDEPEDNLRRNPLINRWINRSQFGTDRCTAVVYASRMHYDMIGSGLLVGIENLRSSVNQRDVPAMVSRFFDTTPNAITFERTTTGWRTPRCWPYLSERT